MYVGYQTEYFHEVRLDREKAHDVSVLRVKHIYFTTERLFSTHSQDSVCIALVFFEAFFFPPKDSVCIAVFFETFSKMYRLKIIMIN